MGVGLNFMVDNQSTVPSLVRAESRGKFRELQWRFPEHLPLLEIPTMNKSFEEVKERALSLHLCVAIAFGLSRKCAQVWVSKYDLSRTMTAQEWKFILKDSNESDVFKNNIGDLEALAWILGLVDEINLLSAPKNNLVTLYQNLKAKNIPNNVFTSAVIKGWLECFRVLDFAYCLDAYFTDSVLMGVTVPKSEFRVLLRRRRHAIEWYLSDSDWLQVSLDT